MKKIITVILLLMMFITGYAQRIVVYKQLDESLIKVSASSELNKGTICSVVNGDGMQGCYHVANNLGHGMWLSEVSKKPVRYNKSTHEGVVWFLCDFGKSRKCPEVDLIQIWNYNQNEHTRRGLNKVYIEYSEDGNKWQLLKNGDLEYYLIPESVGRNPGSVDFSLDTKGIKARYICFTAALDGEGNHYDRKNPVVIQEAADMHQNVDYYGLSEIRFYKKTVVSVQSLGKLDDISFVAGQGYLKSAEGPKREFLLRFNTPLYAGATLTCQLGDKIWNAEIEASKTGVDEYKGYFPAGYMEETSSLEIKVNSRQGCVKRKYEVPGARKWTVCFFPHSHLDIGYTHRQDDVMKLQWRNLERALDLAERTKEYPEGSRYCWNTEATWAVAAYLKKYAATEKAERLKQAIRDGIINVDMSLGSILTGISRQEELMHIFDDAHWISDEVGVELNTAMMSDVPGQAWGLVTAMAKNGVKYYSPGPNYVPFYGRIGNDRAAALHVRWGDRPFYWQSQSGTDKVLVWQAGRGYSWFHGWLANRIGVCGLEPIWDYLTELETEEFPYQTCYLRYTVHGDNGPPDQSMSDVIREWNERYESPQFRISTARELNDKNLSELQSIAQELGIKKTDSLKKEELVYKILDEQAIAGATKKVAAEKLKEERKVDRQQKRTRVTVKKESTDKVFTANKNGDLTKAKAEASVAAAKVQPVAEAVKAPVAEAPKAPIAEKEVAVATTTTPEKAETPNSTKRKPGRPRKAKV